MRDKAFNIAKNPKNYRYQKGLILMVYSVFDIKTAGGAIENKSMSNNY